MSQVDAFPEAHVDPAADGDERYTTRDTLELCRRLAEVDVFDLDVAACEESHCAHRWFTAINDGLKRAWVSEAVFCNPPFSNIGAWVEKAWRELEDGNARLIAMLLPANRCEQPWFQELVEPFRDVDDGRRPHLETHFLPGRVKFGHPGNPQAIGVGSPPFGCMLLVFKHL